MLTFAILIDSDMLTYNNSNLTALVAWCCNGESVGLLYDYRTTLRSWVRSFANTFSGELWRKKERGTCMLNTELRRGRSWLNKIVSHFQVTTLGKLFTRVLLTPGSIIWNSVAGQWCPMAEKVTVGLVRHWLCITDLGVLSTYEMKA